MHVVSFPSCFHGDVLLLQIQFQHFFFHLEGEVCVHVCVCVWPCASPGARQADLLEVGERRAQTHTHIHTLGGDYVVPSARLEHSVVWLIRPGTLMDEHTQPANKHTHTHTHCATCYALDVHTQDELHSTVSLPSPSQYLSKLSAPSFQLFLSLLLSLTSFSQPPPPPPCPFAPDTITCW